MIPVTPAFAEALRAPVTRPVLLFELLRENDALRIWNRYHTLDWAGHKWTGAGSVVSVSPLTETTELQVQRTILTFAAPEISEEAERVVAAGRPRCVMCGMPMGPGPHACANQNGHLRAEYEL